MPSPFIPLETLKKTIAGCRADLKQIRGINTQLQTKIAAQKNRSQYRDEFIQREVLKLQEEARESAALFIEKEQTVPHLNAVSEQSDHWSIGAYLNRAAAVPEPFMLGFEDGKNAVNLLRATVALLRTQNALMAMQRMTTKTLAELASSALERSDWPSLGVAFTELTYRGDRDDSDMTARTVKVQLEHATIPEIQEATNLISEGAEIKSLLDYTLRSISEGTKDIGLRFERYAQIQRENNGDKQAMRDEIERDRKASAAGTYQPPRAA
jgi:hypothetical protein